MADIVQSLVGRRAIDAAGIDAIECLESWLELARSGEITSVAIAGVGPGRSDCGHSTWVDANLVGTVGILHTDLALKLRPE